MKKLIVGTLATVLLLAVALLIAPSLWAQAPPRPPNQFELPLPLGPGSSIGVSVRDLSADEIAKAKLKEAGGALVSAVTGGSPAAKAGLKSEDIVVEFDGERVRGARHLTRLVQETPTGRTVKATVVRGGPKASMAEIKGWSAEVFLPFGLLRGLGNVPPQPGTKWRANFYRIDYDEAPAVSYWAWSEKTGANFHKYEGFGTITFS